MLQYHKGHRKRLREMFLQSSTLTLTNAQILELLLFYCVPRADTKPIAYDLLRQYGSIERILNANTAQLLRHSGVGESMVCFFKLLLDFSARLLKDKFKKGQNVFSHWNDVLDYCYLTMGFKQQEYHRILYLDSRNNLIVDDLVSMGHINNTQISSRDVVRKSLEYDAASLILIHNHPTGNTNPSKEDIDATMALADLLASIDVRLHDHVIVSENSFYSFRNNQIIV